MASDTSVGRIKRWRANAKAFLEERYLETDPNAERGRLEAFAHFWLLVVKSFLRNRCPVRASALAYTTLLSLIPVLAVVVSVSMGLLKSQGTRPVEQLLDSLVKNVAPQLNLVPRDNLGGMEAGEAVQEADGDARKRVVAEITSYIGKIQSGALGITGVISLIVVAVLLLSNIETTFNDIWGVARGRSWFARVVQYWAAITLGPLILLLALALTSGQQFVSAAASRFSTNDFPVLPQLVQRLASQADPASQVLWSQFSESSRAVLGQSTNPPALQAKTLAEELNKAIHQDRLYQRLRLETVALSTNTQALLADQPQGRAALRLNRLVLEDAFPGLIVRSKAHRGWLDKIPSVIGSQFTLVLPFLLLTCGFGLFYGLMPNTRVHWRAAFVGGLVGGILWQSNNLLQVVYVSKVVSYSKIYGSLAVVPVFLVGLYFSWLILLFGAQVAYAFQNRQSYLQTRQAEAINQQGREFVAVRLMTRLAQAFQRGEKPPTAEELGRALGVPTRLIAQIVQVLTKQRLVVEVNAGETACQPGRPLSQISLQDITQAMRTSQGAEPPTREDGARGLIRREVDRAREAERQVAAQVTLQMLVDGSRDPSA